MERRTLRERKVSQRMAVVDHTERKQALAARLEALENDNQAEDPFAADSGDEEFILRDDSDEGDDEHGSGRKRKKKAGVAVGGGMRKTRGMLAEKSKGPKTFKDWLDEAELDREPASVPTYLTAAVGPPTVTAARKFCSVCGDMSGYTCTRCGSRYCSRRCFTVHTETRCLKFIG